MAGLVIAATIPILSITEQIIIKPILVFFLFSLLRDSSVDLQCTYVHFKMSEILETTTFNFRSPALIVTILLSSVAGARHILRDK
jgi:hypothetical protein